MFYYSTSVFEEVIDRPSVGTVSIGAVNVVFTYVALLLMDRCERRSLFLFSIGGMFLSLLTSIFYQAGIWDDSTGLISLLSVNAYVAFYAIGMGPIPSLWITEMVPPRYVSCTMSVCSQANWLANFLVGLAFPLMREQLGGWTFAPFAVVLLVSFLFVWAVLPLKKRPASDHKRRHRRQEDPDNKRDGLVTKPHNRAATDSKEQGGGLECPSSSVWV